MQKVQKEHFTVEEAAPLCGTSIWTIYRRIHEGAINAFRAGGGRNVLIPREALLGFMRRNRIPIPGDLASRTIKLLIVDDDDRVVTPLERFFGARDDFVVQTAASGFAAGLAIRAFRPDVILLDIMLGDLDGRELCRELRRDPALRDVRVIGFSGYLEEPEIRELLESGFDDFIAKPIRPKELLERLSKL